MALTRKMFLKTLPRALDSEDYVIDGDSVTLSDSTRTFTITFVELPDHKIGNITVPRADVTLELTGYSDEEAEAAIARFERYFHRGGG